MANINAIIRAVVGRSLPVPAQENVESDGLRVGRFDELFAITPFVTKHALADEGSYFVATTPSPGTGIATNAVETSFSDTRGFIVIGNTDSPTNTLAKRIYLDYVRLILSAPPTATVSQHFAVKRSPISREPTTAANKTLLTPVSLASGSGRVSVARPMCYANAGAMTVPASLASDPVLARLCLPTSLGIAGDEYILKFGGEDVGSLAGLTAVRAAAPARIVAQGPPIIIEPGEWLVIHRWWLTEATNGPTYEIEVGWFER